MDKKTLSRVRSAVRRVESWLRPAPGSDPNNIKLLPWYALTPVGGISARTGYQCHTVVCTLWYIDNNKIMQPLLNNDGTQLSGPVLNWAQRALPGSVYARVQTEARWFEVINVECPLS